MKFRAAVLSQVGEPLKIETLELRGLADTAVLVRIEATSICHTGVEVIHGHQPHRAAGHQRRHGPRAQGA